MNYEVEYWTSECFIQHDAFRLNLVIIKCIEMVSVVVDVSRITDPICFSYIYLFLVMLINKSLSNNFLVEQEQSKTQSVIRDISTTTDTISMHLIMTRFSRNASCWMRIQMFTIPLRKSCNVFFISCVKAQIFRDSWCILYYGS